LFSNRVEKEQRVVELYQQGKTIREIAHEVHMSFGDIGNSIRKFTGDPENNKNGEGKVQGQQIKIPSNDTKAFKLFLQGKRPVDAAVKLDLSANEINRIYQDFWRLQRLFKLTLVYKEIEPHLSQFLRLFKIMKKKGISEHEMVNAIMYANEFSDLKVKVQSLEEEIVELEHKKDGYNDELFNLQDEISYSKKALNLFQSAVEDKKWQMASMNVKLAWLQQFSITSPNNNEYYSGQITDQQNVDDTWNKHREENDNY
jgi:hypothetical protein